MAPRAKPKTKTTPAKKNSRQTETGPLDATPIVKPSRHAGARRSALEGVRPSKQPWKSPPPRCQLSEKNLRIFNEETEEEKMDPANTSRHPGIKRSLSRRSTTTASEATQDTTRAPRSSGTAAYYRYTHLADADVYIHTKPPDDIQKAIDAIVKAKPSKERLAQLDVISQEFHTSCAKAVQAAIGEDDCINIFQNALTAMNHGNMCLRAKAAWREELKPKIQQSGLNLNFMDFDFTAGDQQQEVGNTSSPPRKRQFAGQSYISPQTSITNGVDSTPANKPVEPNIMPPPPPLEQEGDSSSIKTPHPDISIGTQLENLISALSSQHLNINRAKKFIAELQKKMVYREPDGSQEPMLISVPAPRASDLVFPFAVIEGKAYSTGKQVFEAENQAAVSGACGLKIQFCLDSLAKGATTSSGFEPTPSKYPPPLFFSICTQGPYYELWVHWTEVEDSLRKFNQALLEICHGVLLKTVTDFIVAVDNVLRWGTGPFLDSVVDRLEKVARKAGA